MKTWLVEHEGWSDAQYDEAAANKTAESLEGWTQEDIDEAAAHIYTAGQQVRSARLETWWAKGKTGIPAPRYWGRHAPVWLEIKRSLERIYGLHLVAQGRSAHKYNGYHDLVSASSGLQIARDNALILDSVNNAASHAATAGEYTPEELRKKLERSLAIHLDEAARIEAALRKLPPQRGILEA